MGKATQDLRNEHSAILYVLKILDKMMVSENSDPQSLLSIYYEVVDFLKIFADKCHHGKEEGYLFPELVRKGIPDEGGPVGVMLQEHVQGRSLISQMFTSLEQKDLNSYLHAAVLYRDLLRAHIEKENQVLFVMADRVISEAEQDVMFESFERHEEEVIGHGVHEKLHARIDAWAKTFGVD